jgi:hypothetical protein
MRSSPQRVIVTGHELVMLEPRSRCPLGRPFAPPSLGERQDPQLIHHRFVEMVIDDHLDAVGVREVIGHLLPVVGVRVTIPEPPVLDVDNIARGLRNTPAERHLIDRVVETGLVQAIEQELLATRPNLK